MTDEQKQDKTWFLVRTLTTEYLVEAKYTLSGETKVPFFDAIDVFGERAGRYASIENPIQVLTNVKNGSVLLVGNPYIHNVLVRSDCIVSMQEAPREVFPNIDKYHGMFEKGKMARVEEKMNGFVLPEERVAIPPPPLLPVSPPLGKMAPENERIRECDCEPR